jgi:iron complex transport system substrate-binding protein
MKALLLILAMLASGAHALELVDDRNITVTLAQSPRRIVSLLPSLTETVCALGKCQLLVGVDRYSNFPKEVQSLPQVGGGIDPVIEAVVALRPDVVLMATSSRGGQRLEALGIKVVALEPRTPADVQRVVARLGVLLEVPDAMRIWRDIDAGVTAAARSLPAGAPRTRVYFEVSRGPYGAGVTSFIGEMMERIGVQNIMAPELGPFPKINPEYVVRANPDLIMIGERNLQGLAQRPGWANIRAMKENRVCAFTAEESDILVRPGPRMAEAARLMAACVKAKGLSAAPAARVPG